MANESNLELMLDSDREFLAACINGTVERGPDFLEQVTRAKQRFLERKLFDEALQLRNIERDLQADDLRLTQ